MSYGVTGKKNKKIKINKKIKKNSKQVATQIKNYFTVVT